MKIKQTFKRDTEKHQFRRFSVKTEDGKDILYISFIDNVSIMRHRKYEDDLETVIFEKEVKTLPKEFERDILNDYLTHKE